MNIAQGLAHAKKAFGTRLAVVCGDTRYTWDDFDQRTDALACGLASLGVQRGDRVVVLILNDSETKVLVVDKTFAPYATGRASFPTVQSVIYSGGETPTDMINYEDVVSKGA